MIALLKKIFGGGTTVDFKNLVSQGAVIIDVRTPGEYSGGHIKGSINMPLDTLGAMYKKLPKDKAVITCCASGMRSASAKSFLQTKGIVEVYNGGGWYGLQQKLS